MCIIIWLVVCEALRQLRWKITFLLRHLSECFDLFSVALWKWCCSGNYSSSCSVRFTAIMCIIEFSKTIHITDDVNVCSFDEWKRFCWKTESILKWGKHWCFWIFFNIHLYPQTQRTEPILIWPCGLLCSPYWKSKYSHSDKKKQKGQPASMMWGENIIFIPANDY